MGIYANGIVVGGEFAVEYNTSYADHLLRRVFHPRHLFAVTPVVDDGNAKILTKCRKTSPIPNREGAPRKRKDGPKTPPKPYWGGRFCYIWPKKGEDTTGCSDVSPRK